jgi:hypothetical protein
MTPSPVVKNQEMKWFIPKKCNLLKQKTWDLRNERSDPGFFACVCAGLTGTKFK